MSEYLGLRLEQEEESLPMPESQAVLGNELKEGMHRFGITERKIETGVALKGKKGTYTRLEIRARPLDVELALGKSLGTFFAYNLKTSTACGQFLKNQGVHVEHLDNGRVKLVGLIGSSFKAEVVHAGKDGVVYANIDRDTTSISMAASRCPFREADMIAECKKWRNQNQRVSSGALKLTKTLLNALASGNRSRQGRANVQRLQ